MNRAIDEHKDAGEVLRCWARIVMFVFSSVLRQVRARVCMYACSSSLLVSHDAEAQLTMSCDVTWLHHSSMIFYLRQNRHVCESTAIITSANEVAEVMWYLASVRPSVRLLPGYLKKLSTDFNQIRRPSTNRLDLGIDPAPDLDPWWIFPLFQHVENRAF